MEDKNLLKIKTAKTQKGKSYLKNLLPKLIEDPKQSLFINTTNSSEIMRMIMNDLYLIKKDYSKKLSNKEKIININFNHEFLDVFEFEVTNYIPIEYFKKNIEIGAYMKPIIIFQGEIFETEFNYERLKNFFFDYFKLYNTENVIINELKRIIVISCDSNEKIVKIRNYQINGEINEQNLKNLNLVEIGPSLNLKEKKFILADDNLYKNSLKQPKNLKESKEKNIEKNKILGIKRGRLHINKQNLNAVSLKKYKKILGKKRFGKKGEKFEKENN